MDPEYMRNRAFHDPFSEMQACDRPNGVEDADHRKSIAQLSTCDFDDDKRPLNPLGATGIYGRGLWFRWGANEAVDPIVVRYNIQKRIHEVLLVRKAGIQDLENSLAFPGGMGEGDESIERTLRRELSEEAVKDTSALSELLDESKCSRKIVYKGPVDDYRNTDNAFATTTAVFIDCSIAVGNKLELSVTDTEEIEQAAWYAIDTVTSMYASHIDWLQTVKVMLGYDREFVSSDDQRFLSLTTSAHAITKLEQHRLETNEGIEQIMSEIRELTADSTECKRRMTEYKQNLKRHNEEGERLKTECKHLKSLGCSIATLQEAGEPEEKPRSYAEEC
jgi:8-oxo-dGTP pyrophosphatase MutT (NUDIX family)